MRTNYPNTPQSDLPDRAPPDAIRAEFARRLHNLMIERGWNQSELARQAEMHANGKRLGRDNMSVYIRGKVLPGPLHLNAIAKALDVNPADLLPTRGAPKPEESCPAVDVRDMGDGRAWLRINKAVDWNVTLQILEMLKG